MLIGGLWILGGGFFAGQIARRIGVPPLLGMIMAGILLGPEGLDRLDEGILASGDALRTIAVMIILMKAGLGLDRDKLAQQGSVALRLGFLPAATEALAVMGLSVWLFGLDWGTGLLLGCILGAESPAVIVPGMLRLKSLGWGVDKGIPDAILTGSALSDVSLLLVFSLLLNLLSGGEGNGFLTTAAGVPVLIVLQMALGLILGWGGALILVKLLPRWTQTGLQATLITACFALTLVLGSSAWPFYSGYLAVMGLGFFLTEQDPPLARRIRGGFDGLWAVAEIVLFVLLGAAIQISVLGSVLLPGILLLLLSLACGRMVGWWLSTVGSNWTRSERLFLLPGNMAKATVQAAIGALPLAAGLAGGETILALSALSILVTAPLGAWATGFFAPKLLQKGTVDPTKVGSLGTVVIVAAVDGSPLTESVLTKAGDLARRTDGRVEVLFVEDGMVSPAMSTERFDRICYLSNQLLTDIRHHLIRQPGSAPEVILQVAQSLAASDIVMGKRPTTFVQRATMGSTTQAVLQSSRIPVIVVEAKEKV
ncbi:MAG: universal stress protein [Synechococcaceae cyanobacterium SM2_3_2]|nr:universal stress protein [Synechococcaceae cyanobacterium SM2_3_2]